MIDIDALGAGGQQVSELDKVLEHLMKKENIHHNTELSSLEINAFSTLGVLGKNYNLTIIEDWLQDQLKFRVSRGRKGRSEVVKITQQAQQQDEENKRSWLQFGSRGE